ncbi:hypothetical protein [Nocardia sp. NPDC049707]|uniref:hypothetical protein n=1 Tax=Nocardia sp. NPDC049707 TaxID=3154735 RepID=UPI003434E12E
MRHYNFERVRGRCPDLFAATPSRSCAPPSAAANSTISRDRLPHPRHRLVEDEEFTLEQAEKIDEFAARKLQDLTPGEFMEMFHASVEQDAWLLYLRGLRSAPPT